MQKVPQHLYLGWNSYSKCWCMCHWIHFTNILFWVANLTDERWGWSNHGWSYLLNLTSVISTSATGMPMLTARPLLSIYIRFFTLYQSSKLWELFEWMNRIFYSPSLEESHLSDAGPAMDNSHFVVLPQSHSSEFVPLGWWWWCTRPPWPAQPHIVESPLSGQWGKVNFNRGLMSIWSTGFSQGRKGCPLQFSAPLHMVPPPTGPSPFSSPCRHQL